MELLNTSFVIIFKFNTLINYFSPLASTVKSEEWVVKCTRNKFYIRYFDSFIG